MNKEEMEKITFEMITAVNEARHSYIDAIQSAKNKDFVKAEFLIMQGDAAYNKGHGCHMQLLQAEAAGEIKNVNLLVLHAEDQMISSEGYKIFAVEFLSLYKELNNLKK